MFIMIMNILNNENFVTLSTHAKSNLMIDESMLVLAMM